MNIVLNSVKINEADLIVVPVIMDKDQFPVKSLELLYSHLKVKEKFKGKSEEIFSIMQNTENGPQDIIFVGLGKEEELNLEKIRTAFSKVIKKARELNSEKVYIELFNNSKVGFVEVIKSIVEGLNFGNYKFDKYKTDRKDKKNIEVSICGIDTEKIKESEEALIEASILVETTILARDLVNEPSNVLYPESLAEEVEEYAEKYGFEVEIFDEMKIDDLKMKAFLSVAQGSELAPRFIVMRYFGDESNKSEVLGLVGKGLTYDSGGYSLKPNDGMVNMKSDMGGAATVIGAISAIAKKRLKVNVVAVIAACENLISGFSYKPGDIIGSMAGKTIEVLNTDAEGRLTLVDAVHYVIEKEKATKVIDVATLTGAALIALGTTTTAVITNNDEFYRQLQNASEKSGEKVWMLPAFDEYKKLIKSDIADLKNLGGRHAGTITAGLFIGEFVQNKPWIHLDIAGTAWTDNERDYYSKGGTGTGVRTLYYLCKSSVNNIHYTLMDNQ